MIFVSGGTGYLGRPLVGELAARGHTVRVLVRPGSEPKVPARAEPVTANPLDAATFWDWVPAGGTYVHLLGTPKPAPHKAGEFRTVDLPGALASIEAARFAGVKHFVYVSVAHPAPVMEAYIRVRRECEGALEASGLRHTILRPWYVLGPGHWWPVALQPLYWLAGLWPGTRATAARLSLVKHQEMVRALVWAVENAVEGRRVLEPADIRRIGERMDRATVASNGPSLRQSS